MLLSEERWTSATLPPPRQLPGFQEVFDRTHFHWGLSRAGNDAYHARLRRRAIDEFIFTDIVCDPVTGYRTKDDTKRGSEDYFCLLYFEEGNCLLRQGRNESVVRPDMIAVWDGTRPAMFQNSDQLHQLSIMLPRRMAKAIVPGIEDMCGLTVDGSSGLGAILLSHLRQIHKTIETVEPQDRPAVMRATVELVAAAFRPEPERLSGSSFRRALLGRVQDHILANLSDPALSATTIAAAFRFSPRYLHRLFEEFGVTVGTWIRERRLHAARADLANRAMAPYSVTEIAMRHGFADASHFSHAFRDGFGLSPRAYRQAVAQTADDDRACSLLPK